MTSQETSLHRCFVNCFSVTPPMVRHRIPSSVRSGCIFGFNTTVGPKFWMFYWSPTFVSPLKWFPALVIQLRRIFSAEKRWMSFRWPFSSVQIWRAEPGIRLPILQYSPSENTDFITGKPWCTRLEAWICQTATETLEQRRKLLWILQVRGLSRKG